MSITEKFGNTLRRVRTEKGWSQEYLAKLLGTTKQVISNYETSKRSPNVYTAADYARVLGIPLEDMLDMDPVQSADEDRLEALHQNPKLGLLFDKSRKMSEADIDFMLQFADRIIKENYDE